MKAPFKSGARLIHVFGEARRPCTYVRWWGMQHSERIVVKFDTGSEQTVNVNSVIPNPNKVK